MVSCDQHTIIGLSHPGTEWGVKRFKAPVRSWGGLETPTEHCDSGQTTGTHEGLSFVPQKQIFARLSEILIKISLCLTNILNNLHVYIMISFVPEKQVIAQLSEILIKNFLCLKPKCIGLLVCLLFLSRAYKKCKTIGTLYRGGNLVKV